MQKPFEEQYHRVEREHWWFAARRQVVRALLRESLPGKAGTVLEIGCSGGPLMIELREEGYRDVTGIDFSPDAIAFCREAGLTVQLEDAQKLSFADGRFDVIIASDILEHLSDDGGALKDWWRVLKPGGRLILFVPAFAFLWSEHDVVNKHCRRYARQPLIEVVEAAGFKVERSSYWNAFLFAPVAAVRFFKRLLSMGRPLAPGGVGDLFMPPRLLNSTLLALLRVENALFQLGVNWPVGVSVMTLARRPAV